MVAAVSPTKGTGSSGRLVSPGPSSSVVAGVMVRGGKDDRELFLNIL